MPSAPKANLTALRRVLREHASPVRAAISKRFFKTGPGEYGEGDVFLGITVPALRTIAKQFAGLSIDDTTQLLQSREHEARLCALFILIQHFRKGDVARKKLVYDTYLAHTAFVNNWDLVDTSAAAIVGAYLDGKSTKPILTLAKSENLWEKRIAMIATFHFIRKGEAQLALTVAERFVHDPHDLMQKAVGWMLREVGKCCSLAEEEAFLDRHAATMPRTMLRYAIERFPARRKAHYMQLRSKSLTQ